MRIILFISLIILSSCRVAYNFGVADTGDAKTAFIDQFTVQSALAPPSAGQLFSEKMQDVVQSQSNLGLVSDRSADVQFEGQVTGYSIKPVGVQQNDVAAQNRLTITVSVIYTNSLDDSKNFQQSFTRFADFQSSSDISTVQDQLIDEIYDLIAQDVFNKAFGDW